MVTISVNINTIIYTTSISDYIQQSARWTQGRVNDGGLRDVLSISRKILNKTISLYKIIYLLYIKFYTLKLSILQSWLTIFIGHYNKFLSDQTAI